MTVELNDVLLRGMLLAAAGATDENERRRRAGDLLVHLVESEVLEVWGRKLARMYGRPTEHEECTQVITEGLLDYIHTLQPGDVDNIAKIAVNFYYRCKIAYTRWIDSPAVTVATEMAGISRRYRMSIVARGRFAEQHGRQPTDRELVEFMNAEARANRKDAGKQGAIVNVTDVTGMMLHSYSMDYSSTDDGTTNGELGTPTDGGIEERAAVAITTKMLGELADSMHGRTGNPTCRDVLGVWMRLVRDGETPTVSAIAAEFGISRKLARTRIDQINQVLAEFRERRELDAA